MVSRKISSEPDAVNKSHIWLASHGFPTPALVWKCRRSRSHHRWHRAFHTIEHFPSQGKTKTSLPRRGSSTTGEPLAKHPSRKSVSNDRCPVGVVGETSIHEDERKPFSRPQRNGGFKWGLVFFWHHRETRRFLPHASRYSLYDASAKSGLRRIEVSYVERTKATPYDVFERIRSDRSCAKSQNKRPFATFKLDVNIARTMGVTGTGRKSGITLSGDNSLIFHRDLINKTRLFCFFPQTNAIS